MGKASLIHEIGRLMTVLKELLFSLVYYFAVKNYFGKELESYEALFKRSCRSGNRFVYLNVNPHFFQYEGY